MSGKRFVLAVLAVSALVLPAPARAASYTPFLQLEIKQGVYDATTQSTVATTNTFTLYAYLTPVLISENTGYATISDMLRADYYISAALSPKVGPTAASLGSFTFNGTTVNATADMLYGNPPVESFNQGSDPGDQVRSDIYSTYFKEFGGFKFQSSGAATECNPGGNVNCATPYDVVASPGFDQPTPTTTELGAMYYLAFTVDTTALSPNYQLNFDLYNQVIGTDATGNQDRDIRYMAAAAYDARSRTMDVSAVPEPSSLLLLGAGAAAIAIRHARRARR